MFERLNPPAPGASHRGKTLYGQQPQRKNVGQGQEASGRTPNIGFSQRKPDV